MKLQFSTSLILLCMFLLTSVSQAQVLNDTKVNYQVSLEGVTFDGNFDSGFEEPTWIYKVNGTSNASPTQGPTPVCGIFTNPDMCYYYQDEHFTGRSTRNNIPITTSNDNDGINTITTPRIGVADTHFEIEETSFERDNANNFCTYQCGDDRLTFTEQTFNIKSTPPSRSWLRRIEQTYLNGSATLTNTSINYAWRYANGDDRSNALDFGDIGTQILSHDNATFEAPEGYDERMGYKAGAAISGAGVWYKFEIPAGGKRVAFSTPGSHDNFASIWNETNPLAGQIIRNNAMTRNFCEGIYYVSISIPFSSTQGNDFTLMLTPSDLEEIEPGTITATTDAVCAEEAIPRIANTTLANLDDDIFTETSTFGNVGSIDYQWQKSTNDGLTFTSINGATDESLESSHTGIKPTSDVLFRREASYCGANAVYSDTVTITATTTDLLSGMIEVVTGPGTTDANSITIPSGGQPLFSSSTPATSSFTPITYLWETKKPTALVWDSVGIGTSYATTSGIFTEGGTHLIRQAAIDACGFVATSNEIDVIVVPKDGSISGRVTSSQGGPIGDVTITAVRTTMVLGGDTVQDTYTTTTDNTGDYQLNGLYYGPGTGAAFTITATKIDGDLVHEFEIFPSGPPAYDELFSKTLSSNAKNSSNVNFTDKTVLSFAGQVYQEFNSKQCGLEGVVISLDGIAKDTTDELGSYILTLPSIGTYSVTADYFGHMFSPSFTDVLIDENKLDQAIQSLDMHSVTGTLQDGCGNPISGGANLTFRDSLSCLITTVIIDNNGQYNITLPAKKYFVQLSGHPDLELNNFFNTERTVDLTEDSKVLNFTYQAKPTIEVTGFPDANSCPSPYNVPFLEQVEKYVLTIKVYSGEIGGCLIDTGSVSITDQISDRDGTIITLPISQGIALYEVVGGEPNLDADYSKSITVIATDDTDQVSAPYQDRVVVLGARTRDQTNTTVTPEIPFMILRDPPGDASSSSIQETETIELATSIFGSLGGSVTQWRELKLGTKFEAGFLGFSTETKVWGTVNNTIEIGATANTNTESILSMTTSQKFSTSGNDKVTGETGDVFIGAALNLLYSNVDVLSFNEATCTIKSDVDLIVSSEGFATEYIYTERYIRETIIPELTSIADNSEARDSVLFYRDQINVWEQTLQRNEQLKQNAILDRTISFSNNVEINESTTKRTTEKVDIEFLAEINGSIATAAGMEVAGSGLKGGVAVKLKIQLGESTKETSTKTLTTGYKIYDNDIGDGFVINVKTDPVYMTPVFELVSGKTSCPWEPGTLRRDVPMLAALNPIASDIPVDEEAAFTLRLTNDSNSGEDRIYYLRLNQESNPSGAEIKVGGSPYIDPIRYSIPTNGFRDVTVKVSQGLDSVYTYEGLEFELYSLCDKNRSEKVLITTFFQSPCSQVSLFAPVDGWQITSTNSEMNVHIKGYDKDLLDNIQIQYAPIGTSVWQNLAVVLKTNLNDNNAGTTDLGTIVPVNLVNLPDGEYNIRLKLVCSSGAVYSMRASGTVDTKAPSKLGIPQPIDDIYDQSDNDIISQEYDEEINCSNATVVLTRIDNNNEVLATLPLVCFENRVEVTPLALLDYPGAFRVSVTGIEDAFGNVANQANWVFITPGYEIDESCGPLTVANNNADQDGISQSVYRATILESNGSINPYSTIGYKAQEAILLRQGFEVKQAGIFEADIAPCPTNE